MGFGLQQGLCRGIWVCCVYPATYPLYVLIGVNFPCLSITLVEKKHGHIDLMLLIFCPDFPQPELGVKCGTHVTTQDDGMCQETNLLHSWGWSHTYQVFWKTLGMTGYGWKRCKCCLIWIAFINYLQADNNLNSN